MIIPRLKNDLVALFIAAANGSLDTCLIETDNRTACTVVAVSGGYPGIFEKGFEINELEKTINRESIVFHAATVIKENRVLTNGGRVLCVTSFGDSVSSAVEKSLKILQTLHFENMYYRNDIGYEFE